MTHTCKFELPTPVLNSMHWPLVLYRSQYKILVHAYRTYVRLSLSTESGLVVTVPQTSGMTIDNRCFGNAAATLWNNHPADNKKCKTLDALKNLIVIAYSKHLRVIFQRLCRALAIYVEI